MEAQLTARQAGELDHQMYRRGVTKEHWQHLLTTPVLCDNVAKVMKGSGDKKKTVELSEEREERIEAILQVVRDFRLVKHQIEGRVEFAGRCLFRRHCGQRMAKVHVFWSSEDGSLVERKTLDHFVCIVCLGHYVEPTASAHC